MTTPVSPISPSYRPLTPWTPSTPTFTAATLPATPPATPTTGKPPAPPGPARITICGAPGIGKTALALAAAHHPRVAAKFDGRRYFVECESAEDPKALVACVAKALGLEGERVGRKHVVRFLKGEKDKAIGRRESVESSMDAAKDTVAPTPTRSDTTDSSTSSATAVSADSYATLADQQPEPEKKDPEPILLILDAIDRAWKPHINRNDVEDFLSLLADIQHLTLLVTLRGNERPRQIKWTRPFLPALKPLAKDAAQATFLDISDVPADDPDLQEVLEKLVQGCPRRLTTLAGLASFEGCGALVRRWEAEGEGMLVDRTTARTRENGILGGVVYDEPESFGEDGKMQLPDGLTEEDVWSVLDPTTRWAIGRAFPALIPAPSSDASSSSSSSGTSTPALSRSSSSASSSLNSAFSSSASTAAHSHSRAHSRTGSIFSSMFTPSRSSSKGSFSSSSSHSNHNHARYPSIDSILYALPSPPTTPPFSFSRLSESLPGRKQSEATPAALACLQSSALYPPSPAPASMQRLVGLVPPTTKVGGGEGEP
ncbi:hypothetical protein C8F01DRAFT_1138931 [Mycena amicta]|nr:hypothetical protein C8F01DRAFT_1138931 [Mycena amicta]